MSSVFELAVEMWKIIFLNLLKVLRETTNFIHAKRTTLKVFSMNLLKLNFRIMILKTPLHNSNYIMLTRLDSNTVPLIYYAFAYLGGYKITSPCRKGNLDARWDATEYLKITFHFRLEFQI